ncbi:hypothetical protein [Paenibacillus sp. LC231]|nr:hypothetical protein [Paenibacillus sp. LC231]
MSARTSKEAMDRQQGVPLPASGLVLRKNQTGGEQNEDKNQPA